MRGMKVHNPNNLPTIPIADLLPSQGDLKDLSEKEYNKLKNVIIRRGFSVPVYIWEDKEGIKHLLDGHGRRRVLTTEGWNDPIPYLKIPAKDMQEAMARLLEITSQYQKITQEGIDEFIGKYELNEAEVYEATSFDALTSYGETEEPEVEEDEAPEVDESETPKSKLGEVYQLGRHRLMCADSTVKENVELLMGGEKADMAYTDPPYGMSLDVDYDSMFKNDKNHKTKGDRFDAVIDDDKYFDPTTILNILADVKEVFLWGADYFYDSLPRGGSLSAWDKRTENLDKVVGNTTEFLWSKQPHRRMTARVLWSGHHGMGTADEKSRVHPTQKPLKLHEWFFSNYGSNHKNIIDLFLGSGSTLIACEQTDRTCYGMEISESYTDVVRKRWAKYVHGDEVVDNGKWEELTPKVEV